MNWRSSAAQMGTLIATLALAGLAGCSCGGPMTSDQTPTDGGAGGRDGAAGEGGDAGVPWDPVWHKTTPAQYQTVGSEGQPDCGPGCRIALSLPISHNYYYGHAFSVSGVADHGTSGLVWAPLGSQTTYLIVPRGDDDGVVEPYLQGDFAIYLRGMAKATNFVELLKLSTGETKTAYAYSGYEKSVALTALNSSYAFWIQAKVGVMSRHLQTGEIRVLLHTTLDCAGICATESGLVCGDTGYGQVIFIDQQTKNASLLHAGPALQADSACSPDRTKLAWVDYRDPPGQDSTYMLYRSGGEVYAKDLASDAVSRVSFDSPENPRRKAWPATDGALVVWSEPCSTCDPNPDSADFPATRLVRFDSATGKKCRAEDRALTLPSLHGSHLYGYWTGPGAPAPVVVDVDLDDPAIAWECE